MSSQFEEECKIDCNHHSISSEEFDFQAEEEPQHDAFVQEKVHKEAFDVSIERIDSEGNALPIDEVLDKMLDKIETQKKKEIHTNHEVNELHYFHNNFNLQFQEEEPVQQVDQENNGSIVQKIRDSVELRKHKSFKSQRESLQDAVTDTSKLNTTQYSFFDSNKMHDLSLPMKKGYLLKKSPTLFQGFQKRYCTLDNFFFNYYLPENVSKIFGTINLQIIEIKIEEVRETSTNQLQEFKSTKVFHFKSCDGNSQTLEEWVSAIRQHVEQAQYFLFRYKTCKLDKSFWKFPMISEHKFKSECDTGDIILFRNRNIGSAIQRTLTTSDYDHVGMILKYKCGKIVLFESNTKSGVNLIPWEQISQGNWDNQFDKISYRKLHYKRTPKQVQGIFEFMKNTLGKQFEISTKQLLKSASDRISRFQSRTSCESQKGCQNTGHFELSELYESKQTFFCSELIASCYQSVQLLPIDSKSDSYWPVDFSDKKKLNFQQKAFLSCEYQIVQPIQSSSLF